MEKDKILSLVYKQRTWNGSLCKFSHLPLNKGGVMDKAFLEHLEGSTDRYTQEKKNKKTDNCPERLIVISNNHWYTIKQYYSCMKRSICMIESSELSSGVHRNLMCPYMGHLKLGLLDESISSYIQNIRDNLEDLKLGS